MRKLLISAVFALVAAVSGLAIAGADPVVGTWKLNASKSTFMAGPALKTQTRTYTQIGPTITLVMKSVGADGSEATSKTSYQLDGKDYPVAGNADFDSLSAQQIDSSTAKFTLKKGGKKVGTTERIVSKDGKTLTSTMKLTTAKGDASESELVFDRQ
jgi:hypothetical protein